MAHKPQTKGTVLLVCGLRQRLESSTPHHQRRPPQRGRWHRQKNKNRSPSAKNQNQEGRDTSRPPIIVVSYWISIICRGREVSRPYHAKSFGKFDHDRPSPTLATIFGPVSKLRSQASLHNMPFPTAQKSPFSTFSVLSPLACFDTNSNVSTHWKHAEGMSLRYDAIFTL